MNTQPHIDIGIDPATDIDLPFPPDPAWTSTIGHIDATLPQAGQWQYYDGSIPVRIGVSQRGIDIGIYQITLGQAFDLVALLADAFMEHYQQNNSQGRA